jgi:hypothetical protein
MNAPMRCFAMPRNEGGRPMRCLMKPPSLAALALAALAAPVCLGQTPVPAPAPSIAMSWLAGVSVDRARVSGGATVRCTVTLLRPAAKPIVVGVRVGKTVTTFPADPNNLLALPPTISRQVTDVPATLTVPSASSSATFEIRTSHAVGAGPLPAFRGCPATYGVLVVYGEERREARFEVSNEPCT